MTKIKRMLNRMFSHKHAEVSGKNGTRTVPSEEARKLDKESVDARGTGHMFRYKPGSGHSRGHFEQV